MAGVDFDPSVIENIALEESDTTTYYIECMAFLEQFLAQTPRVRNSALHRQLLDLLGYWATPPEDRNPAADEDVMIDTHLFGMMGQAIYFVRNQSSAQFREELWRLSNNINQIRGNLWLFYTAGKFRIAGFGVDFIQEQGGREERTPDYRADRNATRVFVEASARSQVYQAVREQSRLLWELLHGDRRHGKQVKFESADYDPGMIVVDLSGCNVNTRDDELPAVAELRQEAIVVRNDKGFVYDTTRDPAFFYRPQNASNVLRRAIDYFQQVDKSTYKVRALLVAQSLRLVRVQGGLAAPKQSVLIVDHNYPDLAIQELARAVYLVSPTDEGRLEAAREQVRLKALELWKHRGRPLWDALTDWIDAKSILGVADDSGV